jgi:3-oxoacyl-[acyl-carrier protein] reductase/meso-butanediol dehydrogenase/(S,S)-butanediol dehydrogenase/diacetyl reductase
MSQSSLSGRVALVTGAARRRGIGRGIALELAASGAAVVVHGAPRAPADLPPEEQAAGWTGASSVAEEIVAAGGRAIAVEADITDAAAVGDAVARGEEALGTIDILVNNAGIAGTTGADDLVALDDTVWHRTVDVNLNATYLVSKAVLPGMLAAGRGVIVNISSLAGRTPFARFGAYGATKAAMIGLTQQMALEFAPTVRCNCVCPGSTDTDMMDGTFARRDAVAGAPAGTAKAAAIARIPMGRQGTPADIAKAVRFLASDDAAWITGQTLNVDGGQRMD